MEETRRGEEPARRPKRTRHEEASSSSDDGEADPDFPQPRFDMTDEFRTLLTSEGVNPNIILVMERLGCISQSRFAHFLNDKTEIVTLICKPAKVPKNQRRMYAGILAGIWSRAAKRQDLEETNKASGSARDDLEDPLPEGVLENLIEQFEKRHQISLLESEYMDERLIGRLRRERERRSSKMFEVSKVHAFSELKGQLLQVKKQMGDVTLTFKDMNAGLGYRSVNYVELYLRLVGVSP